MHNCLPMLKALADETRLRLCHVLLHVELNVRELVEVFGMGQSRISRHLKILSDSGLLTFRRDGLWVFYKAAETGAPRMLLDATETLSGNDAELAHDLEVARSVLAERSLETRRFFDAVAGDWERMKNDVFGEFDLQDKLVQKLPRCGTLLDLGCGRGELLLAMSGKAKTLIGVDNSPKMIDQAKKLLGKIKGEVSLRIGDLEHLPLRDGEADCVVISMALHHLNDPAAGIVEAARVLNDGGKLIIAELDKHANESMRKHHQDRWLGFSKDELQRWLEQAGFETAPADIYAVNNDLSVLLLEAQRTALHGAENP